MSVTDFAKAEMDRAGFHHVERDLILEMMRSFFKKYDSGGAVWAMAPVLEHLPVVKRLIACKPLTPLTGEPDEWLECDGGVLQSKRLPSVFKDPRWHDGKLAYDLDNPAGPREPITFPYMPERAEVPPPEMVV